MINSNEFLVGIIDDSNARFWNFLLKENSEIIFLFPFWRYFEYLQLSIFNNLKKIKNVITKHELRLIISSNMQLIVLNLIKRTLVWEFNVCVKKNSDVTLKEFLQRISSKIELAILFKKYPVLEMLFIKKISFHKNYLLELITRINLDIKELNNDFKLNNYYLQSLQMKGDSHCHGKVVSIIVFRKLNSNNIKKIIYKPRNLHLELSFYNFLKFINNINSNLNIKEIKILDKNDYGWMQYIEQQSVSTPFEKIYYYKLGILLGVCYILNAQDIHYENLIACGTDPMIIDLECLYSPPITKKQYENKIFPSIFDTLLIPFEKKRIDYDVSAILNHANQISFMDKFEVKGDFKKNVYVERKKAIITPSKNILFNNSTKIPVSPSKYMTIIIEGYVELIGVIIKNKNKIIDYILKNSMNLKNRIIFKPTFIYSKINSESYHPILLSDINKYYKYMSDLNNKNDEISHKIIYESEILDLMNGDIPYFSSVTSDVFVKNSQKEKIDYFCYESGLNRVIDKINLLNEEYLRESISQIISSLKDRYV